MISLSHISSSWPIQSNETVIAREPESSFNYPTEKEGQMLERRIHRSVEYICVQVSHYGDIVMLPKKDREIIYFSAPRGSAKESFVGNEAAHNQGLLAASTDIISPAFLHSQREIVCFLPQFFLNSA